MGLDFTGESFVRTQDRICGPGKSRAVQSGVQPAGVIVENNASDVTLTDDTFFKNGNGVIIKDGARNVSIIKSIVESQKQNGILIANGSDVFIGGADPSFRNTIYSNLAGIKLTGSAVKNCQIQNNAIYDNAEGIVLADRANDNRIGPGNVFERNITGISADFASRNAISGNIIRDGMSTGIRFASANRSVAEHRGQSALTKACRCNQRSIP